MDGRGREIREREREVTKIFLNIRKSIDDSKHFFATEGLKHIYP